MPPGRSLRFGRIKTERAGKIIFFERNSHMYVRRTASLMPAAIFLVLNQLLAQSERGNLILENQEIRVEINTSENASKAFGEIISFQHRGIDYITESDVGFAIKAGAFVPKSGELSEVSPTSAKLISRTLVNPQGENLPVITTTLYQLLASGLKIDLTFTVTDTVDFIDGLNLRYTSTSWDTVVSRNQSGIDATIPVLQSGKVYYEALNQIYEFSNQDKQLNLLIRNPYQSMANLNNRRKRIIDFDLIVLWAIEPLKAKEPKGPKLASMIVPGVELRRELELILGNRFPATSIPENYHFYFSAYPNSSEQIIAMAFDDIPFKRWVYPLSSDDPNTPVQKYLIRLLEDHPKMKMSWVVVPDPITSPGALATPDYPKGEWWNAHGYNRLATAAPDYYKKWLLDIENDRVILGYEHRVRLAAHGYHHTPEMEWDPAHEFQYYDPYGHEMTIRKMKEDYEMIGLTKKSLRWFRFPGFKHTRSTIEALIRHDFILFDSDRYYRYPPVVLYYSDEGKIWNISVGWEGDSPTPYSRMHDILSRGKIVMTAGHPYRWFDYGSDEAYAKRSEQFSKAASDFPQLDYLFPDDIGTFADETYDLANFSQTVIDSSYYFSFSGKTTLGQTIVLETQQQISTHRKARIDGMDVESQRVDGDKIFFVLPELGPGPHLFEVPFASEPVDPDALITDFHLFPNSPNPFSGSTNFLIRLRREGTISLEIFDLLGRKVKTLLLNQRLETGFFELTWNGRTDSGERAANGVYIARMVAEMSQQTIKLVKLR